MFSLVTKQYVFFAEIAASGKLLVGLHVTSLVMDELPSDLRCASRGTREGSVGASFL